MQFIKVECSCGRQTNLSSDKFGLSHDEFKVDKVAENLMNLKCRNCHKSAKFIFNEKNQLLFDLTNLTFSAIQFSFRQVLMNSTTTPAFNPNQS